MFHFLKPLDYFNLSVDVSLILYEKLNLGIRIQREMRQVRRKAAELAEGNLRPA